MGQLGRAHWRRGMDLCQVTMVGIAEVLGAEEGRKGRGHAGVLAWGAVAGIPEPGADGTRGQKLQTAHRLSSEYLEEGRGACVLNERMPWGWPRPTSALSLKLVCSGHRPI